MQLRIKLVRDMSTLTDDQRERLLSMEVTMFEGHQREFLYDGPPTPTMDELEDNNDPNDQLDELEDNNDPNDQMDELEDNNDPNDQLEDNNDTSANIPHDQLEWLMNLSDISDADAQDQLDMDAFIAEVLDNGPDEQDNTLQEMENIDLHNQDDDNAQERGNNNQNDPDSQDQNDPDSQDQADSPHDPEGPSEWSWSNAEPTTVTCQMAQTEDVNEKLTLLAQALDNQSQVLFSLLQSLKAE